MSNVRLHTALIAIVALAGGSLASANTVGLWTFDTMTDATYGTAGNPDPVGGETLFDSTSHHLDFVASDQFGSMLLDADKPSVMGTNTYSLQSVQGGGQSFNTPSSALLHRGTTGELTVEFWLKYLRPSPTLGYIGAFDGGSTSDTVGNWDLWGDSNGDIRFAMFSTNAGNPLVQVKTDYTAGYDAADLNWHHIAFTVNNVGTMTSYFDGHQVQQSAIGALGSAPPPRADKLNLGFWTDNSSFGDHDFLIDELRISDVALLPGTGTGVNQLAWNAQLGTTPPVLPARGPAFVKNWVRSRDFTLSAWDTTKYYDLYTSAHFNAVMGGGPEAVAEGVEDCYLGAFTQLNNRARTDIQIALNQGVSAFLLKDEIPQADIAGIANVASYIRSVDDQALLIAGLGSSNPAYIDNVVNSIHPDAIVHGYYPFQGTTSATDDWAPALSNTALVRERALFHQVGYFSYIQSFEDLQTGNGGPVNINDNRRLPTESEFRAEAFAKLSAGVKGFIYYRFQNGDTEDFALVNPAGVTTDLYGPVATANQEFLRLGKSLRYLTSTDWRFRSGGVSATPGSLTAWDPSAGNSLIDAITIGGPATNLKDALVGYFTDDSNGQYFMLVNTFHGDSLDAAAAAVNFTLTFDDSVNKIWRLNRLSGSVEELTLTGHILNLTLPGGTGDLFKFGDGAFAGLAGLAGDYNNDGIVNAADYTVWRDNLGDANETELHNNGDGGGVTESDFAWWKQHFGDTSPGAGGGGNTVAVPEPAISSLLAVALAIVAVVRRRAMVV